MQESEHGMREAWPPAPATATEGSSAAWCRASWQTRHRLRGSRPRGAQPQRHRSTCDLGCEELPWDSAQGRCREPRTPRQQRGGHASLARCLQLAYPGSSRSPAAGQTRDASGRGACQIRAQRAAAEEPWARPTQESFTARSSRLRLSRRPVSRQRPQIQEQKPSGSLGGEHEPGKGQLWGSRGGFCPGAGCAALP